MLQNLLRAFILLLFAVSAAWASPLPVLVSIAPQKWLAEQVGGSLVKVRVLLDKGQDPHEMQPSPEQVTALFRSRIYFAGGLEFERELLTKIRQAESKVEVVDSTAGITKIPMTEHEEHEHGLDPHVWLDSQNLQQMAANMATALAAADPAHAAVYQKNLHTVSKSLAALDQEIKAVLAPFQGQSFLVFHPAFGYFAHAYGLRQEAVEIGGKSPTPKQLYELIGTARQDKAKVIFVQPQFDRKNAETIAQAINGTVAVLDPLAEDVPQNLRRMAGQIRSALAEKK